MTYAWAWALSGNSVNDGETVKNIWIHLKYYGNLAQTICSMEHTEILLNAKVYCKYVIHCMH